MSKVHKTKAISYIQKLREYYLDDAPSQRLLDEKEEELRKLLSTAELKELPGIKALVKDAKENVEAINALLLNDKDLTEKERRALMGERDAHDFYISRLSSEETDTKIKALEVFLEGHVKKITRK